MTMDSPQNTSDAQLWYAIHSLLVNYWRDVDFNEGRNAHDFYLADASFIVGDNHFNTCEGIKTFYAWRRKREKFGSRHLLSDVLVVAAGERRAKGFGVMTLHRATGRPPFRNTVPTLIADLRCECVLGDDDVWRFASHVIDPLFIGDDVPLSLSVNTRHLESFKQTIASDEGGVEATRPPRIA
ncbi:MAG: nuclear transport factor 2 family protein [Bradyrhizobiaceae bacterium]|nr:nuclear transport factor 2 family protein [Bradyrhizobiaceae bacterium]